MARTGSLVLGAAVAPLVDASALAAAPKRRQGAKRPSVWEATQERNRRTLEGLVTDLEVPRLAFEWIVVHHTAVEFGTLEGIDRYHRNHFGDPLGIEYHFLIANGRARRKKGREHAPIGLVQPARWRLQAPATHLFHPERAPHAVAISLMGNFEERKLPRRMLEPLVELTRALMDRLAIPIERVTTHRRVDGRLTQCPGKHFPFKRFIERVGA